MSLDDHHDRTAVAGDAGGSRASGSDLRRAALHYALEDAGARVLFAGREVGDLPGCVEHVIDLGPANGVPKRLELRNEPLPKSGAGKILKRELRAPYWSGHDSMVAGA